MKQLNIDFEGLRTYIAGLGWTGEEADLAERAYCA